MTLGGCPKCKQNNRAFGFKKYFIFSNFNNTRTHPALFLSLKSVPRYEEQRLSEGSNRPVRVYLACVYYIIATLATVGYGDISADHAQERIVSVIIMLIGTIVFALIISTASMIVQVSA